MEQQTAYISPNQKALKRLFRNKPAVGGMIVISLAILVAIFAHLLAPDPTPNANEQVLEIATQPPGFQITMLKKRKNRQAEQSSFLDWIIGGRKNNYTLIPIKKSDIKGNKVIFQPYTGSVNSQKFDTLSLVDVVYPLATQPTLNIVDGKVNFLDISDNKQQINVKKLQEEVKNKHLIEKNYILGTDKYGRDNLSRLILGVRVSLSVGLMAVSISLLIGITLGAIAGYFRGWIDDFIMWLINVFWSIPLLLLVFALVLTLGRDFWQIYLAVGLTMWVEIARIVRGQFLSLREKEYVEAAYSLGFSHFRIITTHILPNTVGPIVVITAANFASAIIIEAGLSFLGIGVQPPTPSWGTMLNEYYTYIGTSKAFLALAPGVAILILVLAFNLLGNGLRDALDVQAK